MKCILNDKGCIMFRRNMNSGGLGVNYRYHFDYLNVYSKIIQIY
jgi:hypothetical protein